MYLTNQTLAMLLIGASFTGAATVVGAYLVAIRAWQQPRHAEGGRHVRPDHGADITYATELAALCASDTTTADPEGQGDVEVEGEREQQPETDITATAPLRTLAAEIREAAGYGPGRPVPPPVAPEFNYARPYVTTLIGGGQ